MVQAAVPNQQQNIRNVVEEQLEKLSASMFSLLEGTVPVLYGQGEDGEVVVDDDTRYLGQEQWGEQEQVCCHTHGRMERTI